MQELTGSHVALEEEEEDEEEENKRRNNNSTSSPYSPGIITIDKRGRNTIGLHLTDARVKMSQDGNYGI